MVLRGQRFNRGFLWCWPTKPRWFWPLANCRPWPKEHDAGLAYSATVCGALPVINIGQRDLIAADIRMLQGIFNSTTNFVLAEMAGGRTYADALSEAQQRGIAETDPTLDVEGWDTANKLVIIANSFLGVSIRLNDVLVRGITGVTPSDIEDARAAQKTIKLLATARLEAKAHIPLRWNQPHRCRQLSGKL